MPDSHLEVIISGCDAVHAFRLIGIERGCDRSLQVLMPLDAEPAPAPAVLVARCCGLAMLCNLVTELLFKDCLDISDGVRGRPHRAGHDGENWISCQRAYSSRLDGFPS